MKMILEQITPDFHVVSADIWEIAKYLIIVLMALLGWLLKGMWQSIKELLAAFQTAAVDIAVMKSNSDNTKTQLIRIVKDLDGVSETVKDHETRIIHIERKIKVS
jgi:FtsZ-interacting cell division protein ZipA